MNYKKTIKDLKELNSQLKGQYSDEQNRNYCLQCKIDKLEKENQELKEKIKNLSEELKKEIEKNRVQPTVKEYDNRSVYRRNAKRKIAKKG